MRDDLGRKVGAVANAAVVLLLSVLALGSSGAEVDHTEVRPWGCRTCPIPAQPPSAPLREDPGLGPPEDSPEIPASAGTAAGAATSGAAPGATTDLPCGDSCPAVVTLLAAACAACP